MKTSRNQGTKKRIRILLLLAMMAFLTAGCSSTKLSDSFDEAAVKEAAQKAVDYMNAGEYEECVAMMSQELQEALPAETLAANVGMLAEQKGAFTEYKSVTVVGQKDNDGVDYAVAVVVAAFEKGNITYTVSFDAGMEIIGIWMK